MTYSEKKATALKLFKQIRTKGSVSLKPKFTSHFFRKRKKTNKLDLTNFNNVISVDTENKIAEVEGLTTFYDLSKECLKYGLLPRVVPELRNITVGGAISGLGVEASSFKFGLVHESIIECEVLTGNGEVVVCSKSKNEDLFYSLPNSLGTIGYVLKCKIKLIDAKKYVEINLLRFDSFEKYFTNLENICKNTDIDFIDGIIFSKNDCVIITGNFTDLLPANKKLNNFKTNIFWKFLKNKDNKTAYLSTWDFLWRWDIDLFWCLHDSPLEFTENKMFRILFGKFFLKSNIISKINHYYQEFIESKFANFLNLNPEKNHSRNEKILQDVCLNIDKCKNFMDWHDKNLSTYPIWICPILENPKDKKYPLYQINGNLTVDIGIYKGNKRPKGTPDNYFNREIEKKILENKGLKGLYSVSYYTEKEFWSQFKKDIYDSAKNKYDSDNIFPNLYSKVVGKVTL